MKSQIRVASLVACSLLLCACNSADWKTGLLQTPSPEEMRSALKDLFQQHPEYSIPEFNASLKNSPAISQGRLVRIGIFECDTKTLSFEAVLTSPNLPMYHIEGRFEIDARKMWRAYFIGSTTVDNRDPDRRLDWYPDDTFSWSKPRN